MFDTQFRTITLSKRKQDAIKILNTLQTPYEVLKKRWDANINIDEGANFEMRKCLVRIGYSVRTPLEYSAQLLTRLSNETWTDSTSYMSPAPKVKAQHVRMSIRCCHNIVDHMAYPKILVFSPPLISLLYESESASTPFHYRPISSQNTSLKSGTV